MGRRVPRFVIVILAQFLVILSLSSWMYVEYLNNIYLRDYVSGFLLADGWILVVGVMVVAMGSFTSLMFRRNKTVKRVEDVGMEANVTVALPTAAAAPKPDSGLHPAVAALKAELSGRGMSFGSMSVPSSEELKPMPMPKPMPTLRAEDRGMPVVPRPTTVYPLVTGPRIVPTRPPMPMPARPVQPEDARGPVGMHPPTPVAPATPRNVSTVITGIIPSQKKKETDEPSSENASS